MRVCLNKLQGIRTSEKGKGLYTSIQRQKILNRRDYPDPRVATTSTYNPNPYLYARKLKGTLFSLYTILTIKLGSFDVENCINLF